MFRQQGERVQILAAVLGDEKAFGGIGLNEVINRRPTITLCLCSQVMLLPAAFFAERRDWYQERGCGCVFSYSSGVREKEMKTAA